MAWALVLHQPLPAPPPAAQSAFAVAVFPAALCAAALCVCALWSQLGPWHVAEASAPWVLVAAWPPVSQRCWPPAVQFAVNVAVLVR